jgi:hypothetical protein
VENILAGNRNTFDFMIDLVWHSDAEGLKGGSFRNASVAASTVHLINQTISQV